MCTFDYAITNVHICIEVILAVLRYMWRFIWLHVSTYVYVYIYIYICVCVFFYLLYMYCKSIVYACALYCSRFIAYDSISIWYGRRFRSTAIPNFWPQALRPWWETGRGSHPKTKGRTYRAHMFFFPIYIIDII